MLSGSSTRGCPDAGYRSSQMPRSEAIAALGLLVLALQPVLLLIGLALAAAPAWAGLRALARTLAGRGAIALALLTPLALCLLLPPDAWFVVGHERVLELWLLGGEMPPEHSELVANLPLSSGLAWALGSLAPGPALSTVWLGLNRAAVAAALLALGATTATLGLSEDAPLDGRAGLIATTVAALSAPLLGFSGSGLFIAPAAALAAGALLCGARRQVGAALALGALAVAARPETLPVLAAALLLPGRDGWRDAVRARSSLLAGAVVAAVEVGALLSWGNPAAGRAPLADVVASNVPAWEVAGPWLAPAAIAVLVVLTVRLTLGAGRRALWIGLAGALALPLVHPDLGSRHFVPASLLVAVLVGATVTPAIAGWSSDRVSRGAAALAGVLLLGAGLQSAVDLSDLGYRWVGERPGLVPRDAATADAGGALPSDAFEPQDCILLPEGALVGSRNAGEPAFVTEAIRQGRAGRCVLWALRTDWPFRGDNIADRQERVVAALDLAPIGWLDDVPGCEAPCALLGTPR